MISTPLQNVDHTVVLLSCVEEIKEKEKDMAACICRVKCHGETWLPRGLASSYQVFNYGPCVVSMGRLGCGCVSRLVTKKKAFVARDCGCDQSEEDRDEVFVKVLREVKPYLPVYSKRVFVLVLSAEIVDSPCLDATLKVTISLPLLYCVLLSHTHNTDLAYLHKILPIKL